VRVYTGEDFLIFQDRMDIKWGQAWRTQVDESLNSATFIIPIITPNFFKSEECRKELEKFLEREKDLGREDLILPVYYVDTPLLKDSEQRKGDKLAQVINERQYVDWRELRFKPFDSPEARKKMAALAIQIRDALDVRVLPKPIDVNKSDKPLPPPKKSTLVVDPMSCDDLATISEAIAKAKRGDRILVRPGLYQEGLVIDKPLEIVGDGERNEIEIRATGKNALLFKTTNGRAANLTLRQMGGGTWYGVDISQGRLNLEDCDISSQSLACVAIHDFADPRLRRNKIHDGKAGGVYVYENGQGTIEENDIFGNALSGVAIATGGNPTLRRNKIHDGKSGGGVYVYENGQGTIEENDIFGNAFAGVEIKEGGNPTVRRNKINRNNFDAIYIYDGGAGIIEDNDLRDNKGGAWNISKESKPNVKRARNLE
jgi:F-box protein 11